MEVFVSYLPFLYLPFMCWYKRCFSLGGPSTEKVNAYRVRVLFVYENTSEPYEVRVGITNGDTSQAVRKSNPTSWGFNCLHYHIEKEEKHIITLISCITRDLNSSSPHCCKISAKQFRASISVTLLKLVHHPLLWPQTCNRGKQLIKHTQVCLKSNLEKISQDRKTLDTIKVNTHAHSWSE